jgi:hypothetical protein
MDTAHKDRAHGTGKVKEGKPGGYAMGGSIMGNEKAYENTKMVSAGKGKTGGTTGGVKMGNAGGFKKGGKVPGLGNAIEGGNWENRPANSAKPGVKNTTTGGVKNGNGGGFKMGGTAKKAYATGGNVVSDGKAEKMPRHFVSRPVANSLQSGTFKKGGKVGKYAEGSSIDAKAVSDKASRELEEAMNPISMAKELYGKAKSYLTSPTSTPGAVTKTKESVTVAPKKKNGGMMC